MNILVYQPRVSYYIGGGEVVPLMHLHYLSKIGNNCTLVTTRSKKRPFTDLFQDFLDRNTDIKIIYIDIPEYLEWIYLEEPGNSWLRWDNESIFVSKIALPIINDINCDIYVAHNIIDSMALPEGKKKVIHLHGYPASLNYLCERILTSNTCHLIAVSDLIRSKFLTMLPNRVNIFVSKNGIDTIFFKPKNVVKNKKFLYIGRLIESKGVQNLLCAISRYNLDIFLDIAGDGPHKDILADIVSQKGLSKKVRFLGSIPQNQLPLLYSKYYFSIFPSLGKEGVLTTMLESSSCGTPCITSIKSSMSEFIINKQNGFLCDTSSLKDLGKCINEVLKIKSIEYNLIRNNAISSICNKWDWQDKVFDLQKIYESL